MITQAANSTKSIKIQPKPEPGISQTLPVVTVPKINKGEWSGGEILCSLIRSAHFRHFIGLAWQQNQNYFSELKNNSIIKYSNWMLIVFHNVGFFNCLGPIIRMCLR